MSAIDEYIASYPPDVQERMKAIRKTVLRVVPDAAESITYRIPTFKVDGKPVVSFAGFDKHISVYPAPVGNPAFTKDLAGYASGKGTAMFPHDKPLPLDVITKIVHFRVKENQEIALAKAARKKRKS